MMQSLRNMLMVSLGEQEKNFIHSEQQGTKKGMKSTRDLHPDSVKS